MTARHALALSLLLALALTSSAGAQPKTPSGPPVKIGVLTPLSGVGAGFGEDAQLGTKLALAEVNAHGGILGRPVVLVIKDDAGDAATAARLALQLIQEEKVDALVAPVFSSPAAAVLPIANDAKIIEVAASFLDEEANATKYPYTFKVNFSAPMVGATYADFIKKLKLKKVGILAADNLQGLGVADGVTASLKKGGIPLTDREVMSPGSADVTPQLDRLRRQTPDALVLAMANGPDYVAALKGLKQIGWNDVTPIGTGAISFEVVIKGAPADVLARSYGSGSFRQLTGECQTAKVKAFRKAISDEGYNHGPITKSIALMALAYDSIALIAHAANGAKSTNGDAMRKYLESHPYTGVSATYAYNAQSHAGVTTQDIVFSRASAPKDGLWELAPGQGCK